MIVNLKKKKKFFFTFVDYWGDSLTITNQRIFNTTINIQNLELENGAVNGKFYNQPRSSPFKKQQKPQ